MAQEAPPSKGKSPVVGTKVKGNSESEGASDIRADDTKVVVGGGCSRSPAHAEVALKDAESKDNLKSDSSDGAESVGVGNLTAAPPKHKKNGCGEASKKRRKGVEPARSRSVKPRILSTANIANVLRSSSRTNTQQQPPPVSVAARSRQRRSAIAAAAKQPPVVTRATTRSSRSGGGGGGRRSGGGGGRSKKSVFSRGGAPASAQIVYPVVNSGPVARRTRSRNVGMKGWNAGSHSKAAFTNKWENEFSRHAKIRKGTVGHLPELITSVEERVAARKAHEALDERMKPRLLFDFRQFPSYVGCSTFGSRTIGVPPTRQFYHEEMLAFHDGLTGYGINFASRDQEAVREKVNVTNSDTGSISPAAGKSSESAPFSNKESASTTSHADEENGSSRGGRNSPSTSTTPFVYTFAGEPQTDRERRALAQTVTHAARRAREAAGLPEPEVVDSDHEEKSCAQEVRRHDIESPPAPDAPVTDASSPPPSENSPLRTRAKTHSRDKRSVYQIPYKHLAKPKEHEYWQDFLEFTDRLMGITKSDEAVEADKPSPSPSSSKRKAPASPRGSGTKGGGSCLSDRTTRHHATSRFSYKRRKVAVPKAAKSAENASTANANASPSPRSKSTRASPSKASGGANSNASATTADSGDAKELSDSGSSKSSLTLSVPRRRRRRKRKEPTPMSGDFEDVTDQISQGDGDEAPVRVPSTSEILRAREMKLPLQQRMELDRSISLGLERLLSEEASEHSTLFSSLPKSAPATDPAESLLLSHASSASGSSAKTRDTSKSGDAQKSDDPLLGLLRNSKSKKGRRRPQANRKRQRRLPPNEADISGIFETEPKLVMKNADDAAATREIMAALEKQERVETPKSPPVVAQAPATPSNVSLPQSSPLSLHRSTSTASSMSNVSVASGVNSPVAAKTPVGAATTVTSTPIVPELSPEEREEKERLRREKKERKKREKAIRKAEKKRRKQEKRERERRERELEALRSSERRVTRSAAAKAAAENPASPVLKANETDDSSSPSAIAKNNDGESLSNGAGSGGGSGGFVYKKRKKKPLARPSSIVPMVSDSSSPRITASTGKPSPLPHMTGVPVLSPAGVSLPLPSPVLPVLPLVASPSTSTPALATAGLPSATSPFPSLPSIPAVPLPSSGSNGQLPLLPSVSLTNSPLGVAGVLPQNGALAYAQTTLPAPNGIVRQNGIVPQNPTHTILPLPQAAANVAPSHVLPLPMFSHPLSNNTLSQKAPSLPSSPLLPRVSAAAPKSFAALPDAVIPGIQGVPQLQPLPVPQPQQGQRFGARLGGSAAAAAAMSLLPSHATESRFAALPTTH